jgi:thymidylate synthase
MGEKVNPWSEWDDEKMDKSMEKRIYSRQNEGDLCEYSIQWKAYLTSKKRGWKLWHIH